MANLNKLEEKFKDKIIKDKPFLELTTLKIGGPLSYFFEAKSEEELIEIIKSAKENSLPYLVIGGGSNLLVSDQGYDGLVIKNSTQGVKQNGNILVVSGGTILQDLV